MKVWIGDYVSFDAEVDSDDLLPLLECLIYAIDRGRPIDFYLKGVLKGRGPAGGDPGWSIHWIDQAEDALFPDDWLAFVKNHPEEQACYEAWTDQKTSLLDPPCAYYSRATVRHEIRVVLENFRKAHPTRSDEIDDAIRQFKLERA